MITLNDLLTIVDARQLRIVVPVTPRLKARITVNTRQTAELDDIIRLYGERPVFSAEPTHEGNVMEIELTDRAEVALETVGGGVGGRGTGDLIRLAFGEPPSPSGEG